MSEPTPYSHIEPTPEAARGLVERGFTGPVVMLNLLRFREIADYSSTPELALIESISGRAAYERYAGHALPFIVAAGGSVVFWGRGSAMLIGPDNERWDDVVLVRYPSAGAFVGFVLDARYRAGLGHRQAALEDSRLLPMTEVDLGE